MRPSGVGVRHWRPAAVADRDRELKSIDRADTDLYVSDQEEYGADPREVADVDLFVIQCCDCPPEPTRPQPSPPPPEGVDLK